MGKRLFQIWLLAMALGLILPSSLIGVFAQVSDTGTVTAGVNYGWKLQIGTNNNSLSLSLGDLSAMPKTIVNAELFCYGQLVESGEWGGVKLGLLLEKAGFDEQATGVQFFAADGYTITLSISSALADNVIIAYEKDGMPLPETLRLVVPGTSGDLWISMITLMSITNSIDQRGPNPYPASVIQELLPTIKQSPKPTPAPTPEPSNQSTAQPIVPPPNSQPVEQKQDSSSSSLQVDYGYPILYAIIMAAAVAAGYMFYKRRK